MAKCYKDGTLMGNIKIGGNQVMAVVKDNVDLWSYPFGGIVLKVGDEWKYSPGTSLSQFSTMPGMSEWDGEICPGYDRFVMETYDGFFVSTNGMSWEQVEQKNYNVKTLDHNLIFVDGVFFSSHGGYLWYSVEGRYFTGACAIPSGKTFRYFCSGNGTIFAAGFYYSDNRYHCCVFRNEDAQNWIASNLDVVGDEEISCIGFGNGNVVAFTTACKAYRSTDNGATFSQASGTITDKIISVAYGGGKFAAITLNGQIYTSEDGSSWSLSTTISTLVYGGIFYAENKFIAYGTEFDSNYDVVAGRVYSSTDGSSWSNVYTASGKYIKQACYCNKEMNRYWLVGASGMAKFSDDNMRTWNSKSIFAYNINCICNHKDSIVVAATDVEQNSGLPSDSGYALISSDFGNTWTKSIPKVYCNVKCVLSNKDDIVALSVRDGSSYSYISVSKNEGASWSIKRSFSYELKYICFGNGKFVAVGNGRILYSTDLATWIDVSGISGNLTKVVCGGTDFVATGTDGTIYYSSNGTTWTRGGSGPSSINCLLYTGMQFLCGGSSNGKAKVYFTNDKGATWYDWDSIPDLNGAINAMCLVDENIAMFGCDKTVLFTAGGIVTYDNQGSSNATAVCSIAGRILP